MRDHLSNSELLRKILEGEISPEAIGDDPLLKKIIEESAHLAPPKPLSTEEAWTRFSARHAEESELISEQKEIDLPKTSGKKIRPLFTWSLRVAAVIGILYFALPFIFNTPKTVGTARAEQASIQLPDQSKVELNAESSITYDLQAWGNDRQLSLEGEALFEVKKGSKFIVKTQWGDIQVLGTRFNVFARNEAFEVACFSGSVQVASATGVSETLTPGQAFRLNKDKLESKTNVFSFEKNSHAQWQKGEFNFDNIPLNHVIAVLERQFDVRIEHPDFGDMFYTGFFSNSHLEDALGKVCNPMSLKYNEVSKDHFKLNKLQ